MAMGYLDLLGRHLLSALILLPLAGAFVLFFLPRGNPRAIRHVTFAVTLAEFFLSLPLVTRFDGGTAAMQFVERADWIPGYGISYFVGLDGISLWLVILTTFLTPLCLLGSWRRR